MRIGELAERVGVSTRALRYYEEQGVLSSARTANGYREYDEHHVQLVVEIRTLLALGFTLDDARPFLDCLRSGSPVASACPDSVAASRRKLAEIDAEIRALMRRRAAVADRLAHACPGCAFTQEDLNDHVDQRDLRRPGRQLHQAGPGGLLGGLVPTVRDAPTDPGTDRT
ncbi:MerR family transcriptional regulator [Spiractinospora alimapuensis]|uniref:MerR family transcriptional regulator n=1 Tax=Spiractinospora alimapuensis TaxID=2820884 RepID=UPI001F3F67AF|nr:MerR family transcriptional regulator [Spiractinospora alimapuensis]